MTSLIGSFLIGLSTGRSVLKEQEVSLHLPVAVRFVTAQQVGETRSWKKIVIVIEGSFLVTLCPLRLVYMVPKHFRSKKIIKKKKKIK